MLNTYYIEGPAKQNASVVNDHPVIIVLKEHKSESITHSYIFPTYFLQAKKKKEVLEGQISEFF